MTAFDWKGYAQALESRLGILKSEEQQLRALLNLVIQDLGFEGSWESADFRLFLSRIKESFEDTQRRKSRYAEKVDTVDNCYGGYTQVNLLPGPAIQLVLNGRCDDLDADNAERLGKALLEGVSKLRARNA